MRTVEQVAQLTLTTITTPSLHTPPKLESQHHWLTSIALAADVVKRKRIRPALAAFDRRGITRTRSALSARVHKHVSELPTEEHAQEQTCSHAYVHVEGGVGGTRNLQSFGESP